MITRKLPKKLLLTSALCLSFVAPVLAEETTQVKNTAPQSQENNAGAPVANVQYIPASFADLAERLSPAVVNISSTQKVTVDQNMPEIPQFPEGSPFQDFFEDFMNKRGPGGVPMTPMTSLGSGFVIDAEKGYIITNNHVVHDAEEVRVTFSDDTTIPAEIIGIDEKTDIAVLKVDPKKRKLVAVPFGNSDVIRVGDWVMAIGNPFGLGGTVTTGIVSARARDIHAGPYDDFLQTDASINRGNSGGPMFNMNGEVIGINTAIYSPSGGSVGIGFSIPSAQAEPVIKQIIQYGRTRRGWLGVRIQSVTDEIAESLGLDKAKGALIADVTPGGPAEKAGLKSGDIILSFNDQSVSEMKSLPRFSASAEIGSDARISYWRDGKELKTTLKIGELEKAEDKGKVTSTSEKDAEKTTSGSVNIDSVGITLSVLDTDSRTKYAIPVNIEGVLISKVKDMSEATQKGITDGNVILEINQQKVSAPQDVLNAIESAKKAGRKTILMLIYNATETKFVAVKI